MEELEVGNSGKTEQGRIKIEGSSNSGTCFRFLGADAFLQNAMGFFLHLLGNPL